MSEVIYEGDAIKVDEGESALDALLKAGKDIPNSCRAGVCQSCLVKADVDKSAQEDSKRLSEWQPGLSDAQVNLNYVLACQCQPVKSVVLNSLDYQGLSLPMRLIEKTWLNDKVVRLRFHGELEYQAGQYVTLWKDGGIARSYSIASEPQSSDYIEFHVKYIEEGEFSAWAGDELEVGESVGVQGPLGKCIYSGSPERPLLLSGIGTGLAPLLGILKSALAADHKGEINVVLGGKTLDSFYLVDELNEITNQHKNVNLSLVCKDKTDEKDGNESIKYFDLLNKYVVYGDVYESLAATFPSLKDFAVYLCGAESFVKKMRRQCFMAGASMQDIHADAFVAANS